MNKNMSENSLEDKHIHPAKPRDVNLDLIRCVALFLLPSLHFFAYIQFYDVPFKGAGMYFMSGIRVVSMCCISLFLMLTGYLMSQKKFGKGYFKGLIRVLIIFFICKTITVIFYNHLYLHQTIKFIDYIKGLSSGGEYSWYVGLYMWLYFLIPLLNIIYNAFDEKWKKQALILAAVGIVVLPTYANFYKADMPDLFGGQKVFTVVYYFIGAYIREYHKEGKCRIYLLAFLLSAVLFTVINILLSYNQNYVRHDINTDWRGFEVVIMSVFLFLFLRGLRLNKMPDTARKILAKCSEWSFGAYLLTWIFDNVYYNELTKAVTEVPDRFKYYLLMVPAVYISSLLVSAIVNVIHKLMCAGYEVIHKKIVKIS